MSAFRTISRPIQAIASSSRSKQCFSTTIPSFEAPKPTNAKKGKSKSPDMQSWVDEIAISSCPPGTVLTGLSVIKDQPDPVALPDDQYPAWLWTVLDDNKAKLEKGEKKEGGEVDFAMQKKRLRAQWVLWFRERGMLMNRNRADIKASNYLKTT
jgi:large subunit ribosomal protein L54